MAEGWTTPDDLAAQVERLWQRGRLLSARLRGVPLFPLPLRLRRPTAQAMTTRFDEVRAWIRVLDEQSRARRGVGYDIVWDEIKHRQLGRNLVPAAIVVPTERDGFALIGKVAQGETFDALAAKTLSMFPALRELIIRKPLQIVENAEAWDRILAVLAWFDAHPRSGLYLRQLDIAGVDSKFVETRQGLLTELLDHALVQPSSAGRAPGQSFEGRFGLRSRPTLVRLRILDPRLAIGGLTDVSMPVEQLAAVPMPGHRVFITENEINGLAFPDVENSIVLFKLGYAVELLSSVGWLADREIFYWGDIDTHGFAILDRLRTAFPGARSLLMDEATLLAHTPLWVREDVPHRADLDRLTDAERALYDGLRDHRFGDRVRLEQERIAFGCLQRALHHLQEYARRGTVRPWGRSEIE